jgi:hypothetical protein
MENPLRQMSIPKSSCHPYEHKISGINYLLKRLHAYPITKEGKDAEINSIKNILRNNEYDIEAINKLPPQKKNTQTNLHNQKTKWATFTYSGREVRKITNLF